MISEDSKLGSPLPELNGGIMTIPEMQNPEFQADGANTSVGSQGPAVNVSSGGSEYISDGTVFSGYNNYTSYGYGGGAIHNRGNISAGNNITFSGNSATLGGAVYNGGNMTIGNNAVFAGNTAFDSASYGFGGAIYNFGGMTIGNNAVFSGNTASRSTNYGFGGAICNDGGMTIGDNADFSDNKANRGGAVYNSNFADMSIGSSAIFHQNTANNYGGAIYNTMYGSMSIGARAYFAYNIASGSTYEPGNGLLPMVIMPPKL